MEDVEVMKAASEQRRREDGTLSPGGGGGGGGGGDGGGDSGGAEQLDLEVPLTAAESSDAAIAAKAKVKRERAQAKEARIERVAGVKRALEVLDLQWQGNAPYVPARFSHAAAAVDAAR
jgi:hypothetical protein